METALPEESLKSLLGVVGKLPEGDVPTAWYLSLDAEVIQAYITWENDYKVWRDRFTELCEISGWNPNEVKLALQGDNSVMGFYVPAIKKPQFWREEKMGFVVPRKRTKAEIDSEINTRFRQIKIMPRAVDNMPGMPHSLWIDGGLQGTTVYPVKLRRNPDCAVLAFLGASPDRATQPFEVGPQWSRMKLSIYHALRERQTSGAN